MTGPGGVFPADGYGASLPEGETRDAYYAACLRAGAVLASALADLQHDGLLVPEKAA